MSGKPLPNSVDSIQVVLRIAGLVSVVLELQSVAGSIPMLHGESSGRAKELKIGGPFPWSLGTSLSDAKAFQHQYFQSQDHGLVRRLSPRSCQTSVGVGRGWGHWFQCELWDLVVSLEQQGSSGISPALEA